MTEFRVLAPEQWGMTKIRPLTLQAPRQPVIYFHHTAGNSYADWSAPEAFRECNRISQAKGYSCSDYSALVHFERDEDLVTIGIARGAYEPAATYLQNAVSKAVCAIGMFHPGFPYSVQPAPELLEGWARAAALMVQRGWARPDFIGRGHRQSPSAIGTHTTACPGDWAFPHVPAMTARAKQLIGAAPPRPPTNGGATVLLYRVLAGDGWYSICRRVYADGQATAARVTALQNANPGNTTLTPGELVNIPGKL